MSFENTVVVPTTSFEKPADISAYWEQLVECDMDYNLDNDPAKIEWNPPLPNKQFQILIQNHETLWDYAEDSQNNPWELIDLHHVKELTLKKITLDFAKWFIFRRCPSIRKASVMLWIESNHSYYKDNDTVLNYVFNHYHDYIEYSEPEDFRSFID